MRNAWRSASDTALGSTFLCSDQARSDECFLCACCRYVHLDEDASILQPHDVLPYPVVVRMQATILLKNCLAAGSENILCPAHCYENHARPQTCHKR